MMYLLLVVGFLLLIKGADYFVDGSCAIARFLKVPTVVIGLTIVAMGTSAPEASVSIMAGLKGNNDIALSNVIGSNIFNLLIVVGVCATLKPFKVNVDILKRDYIVCIISTIILILFISNYNISRIEGIIFIIIMILYIIYMIMSVKKISNNNEEEKNISPIKSIIFIIGGLTAIIFGGDLVVDNASLIASKFGLSDTLIGLTIIAIGTSLPELVTSIVAAKKGESGLALGNVIGSNLFNILFILGMSSAINPIIVDKIALIDVGILLFSTLLLYIISKFKKVVSRISGILCIVMYIAYSIYIVVR